MSESNHADLNRADLDRAFDALRTDVVQHVTGPDSGQIVHRARRRTKIRVAAVAAAIVAVAGTAVTVHDTRQDDRRVLTPPTTAPTLTRAPTAGPRIPRLSDLIYGTTAGKAQDSGSIGWQIEGNIAPDGTFTIDRSFDIGGGGLQVPGCRDMAFSFGRDLERATLTFAQLEHDGTPKPWSEARNSTHGEEVVVFDTAQNARLVMGRVDAEVRTCTRDMTIRYPALGAQALAAEKTTTDMTQNAVVVRQGSAIAVYWAFRHNAGPRLKSLTDHEHDAQTMAQRLNNLGFHD